MLSLVLKRMEEENSEFLELRKRQARSSVIFLVSIGLLAFVLVYVFLEYYSLHAEYLRLASFVNSSCECFRGELAGILR